MAAVLTTTGVEVMSEKCCWANCDNPPGVGTHTQIEVPQIGTAPMVATLAVCEEHWYGNWRQLRAENERLRELLHDIAVARRGNDGRVDEAWDELPEEIEDMWAALAEADDRPWLCPNCGHPAARHFIGACPEYDEERPAT